VGPAGGTEERRAAAAHGARNVRVFGSVARGDSGPESDVDLLVEFEPGRNPGYFGLFDMEDELSSIFGGRKVDIRTPKDLSRYFRQKVVDSAVVEYAA